MHRKRLIVNADDFGLSIGVNRGIIRAHEKGIVTSTSLMVRYPASTEAAEYAMGRHQLGVGLHVDLGEWIYRDEEWQAVYEVVPLRDSVTVHDEIARQLDEFRKLMGREPSHIDSHQHAHRREPIQTAVSGIAQGINVPLRHFCPGVLYCGDFYGQTTEGESLSDRIGVDHLTSVLEGLPVGVTELACHPGESTGLGETMYRSEREIEVHTLCHSRIRRTIQKEAIELCSFLDVSPQGPVG